MNHKTVGKRQLRSFALIVAVGFSVIAFWPTIFRGESPRMVALAVAIFMSAAGLIYPPILRPIFKVWMIIGEALGWVNTRIILTVVYYGLIVPIGTVLRIMKKDPMRRKFEPDAASYRIPRTRRPPSHMQRQY